jgi:hypothetical protein
MIRRHRLLLIIGGFILVTGLALWPGQWSPPAQANVTLVRFTATSVPGQREIGIDWETATELDTSGFFVARSGSSTGPFTRVSGFIIAEGSTVVGASYHFTDTTTVFNQTYYYRLEVINTDQTIDYYGPISAIARPATNTPTTTPSPTATPTTPSDTEDVDPTLPSDNVMVVTPRVAIGATITPRPTSSSNSSSSPTAFAAAPAPSSIPGDSPLPTPVASAAPAVPDAAATAAAPPPPTAAHVAQAPAPTLASTGEALAMVEPVVIAPETAPRTASTNSTNSAALILIAAAIVFLGIAFLILRQVRQ